MTTDWSKHTVEELRAELKKRGLPRAGRKAELVERINSFDEQNSPADATDAAGEAQPSTTPDQAEPVDSETKSNNPSPKESDLTPNEATAAVVEPAVTTAVDVVPTSLDPEGSHTSAQVEVVAQITTNPLSDPDTSEAAAEPTVDMSAASKSEATGGESLPAVGEILQDIQSRKRRSRTPSIDENALRKRARQGDSDVASVDTQMVSGMEASDEPNQAALQHETTPNDQQDVTHGQDNGEAVSPNHQHNVDTQTKAPADQDVEMQDAHDRAGTPGMDGQAVAEAADDYNTGRDTAYAATDADQASYERPVSPAMHPATSAIYIKNLMRPLKEDVLEQYLIELATPPSQQPNRDVIVDVFLDNIKTHAFAQFDTISAASRVRSALHDQVWPDERERKPLWVDFIPTEKVRDWIDQEKAAGQGRGNFARFEVIYETDNDGKITATLEELGPEAARQTARPPPTGPASSIPTGPRNLGVEGAPLGPRGSGGRMGPAYRPQAPGPRLEGVLEGWKRTRTLPDLLYRPAHEELAARRLDNMHSYYTRDKYRDMGKEDEINRYTFENNDQFVDRGKEVFIGIRPPHREAERRRGAGDGGMPSYVAPGGRRAPSPRRRGPPPASRDVDRYVGGRSSARDDFTPRSRFNGAPLPTFDGRSDRRGRNGGNGGIGGNSYGRLR